MKINNKNFNLNLDNIQSVELNLLNGQVEIILRALELYGYNLEYMLNSTDATDDMRQEKIALIKYTYEQVLSSQAEQINGKSNNNENLTTIGKRLTENDNIINMIPKEKKLNVI